MDYMLTGATLFWLFVPMTLIVLFSFISMIRHKGE